MLAQARLPPMVFAAIVVPPAVPLTAVLERTPLPATIAPAWLLVRLSAPDKTSPAASPAPGADAAAGLQRITDAALAYLDLDDLLERLLDAVLAVLGVDTAAVLLATEDGTELFARAAKGLGGEVEQGFRRPHLAGPHSSTRRVGAVILRVEDVHERGDGGGMAGKA